MAGLEALRRQTGDTRHRDEVALTGLCRLIAAKAMRYLANNALGALALFVALGGVSYAAAGGFSGSDGTLQGCVGTHGTLTVIQPGKRRKAGQNRNRRWSVTGPPGRPGRAGSKGAAGPGGPTGPEGAPNPHALTADNALALGGVPASGFTA